MSLRELLENFIIICLPEHDVNNKRLKMIEL